MMIFSFPWRRVKKPVRQFFASVLSYHQTLDFQKMIRKHFERLPTNVIPKHYAVSLTKIDLEKHTFEGQVTVQVQVNEATKDVKLNASELVVSEATFEANNNLVNATDINLNADDEVVSISFASPLQVGQGWFCNETIFGGIINSYQYHIRHTSRSH